jgi:hypothetical protein
MQPSSQQLLICPTCGAALEETPGGELGCMSCLLRVGIGSEKEVASSLLALNRDGLTRAFLCGVD